jgi:hypothetical protein
LGNPLRTRNQYKNRAIIAQLYTIVAELRANRKSKGKPVVALNFLFADDPLGIHRHIRAPTFRVKLPEVRRRSFLKRFQGL